jgi:hypothetical protein
MKNFFLVKIIQWIGRKLDGSKTIIGFILLILQGILGFFRVMWPELAMTIPQDIDGVINKFGEAFIGLGIGHKVQKVLTK